MVKFSRAQFGRFVVVLCALGVLCALPAHSAMSQGHTALPQRDASPSEPASGSDPPGSDRPGFGLTGIGTIDDALASIAAWVARAQREYQSVVVNELSTPTAKGLAEGRADGRANEPAQAVKAPTVPTPQTTRPAQPPPPSSPAPTATSSRDKVVERVEATPPSPRNDAPAVPAPATKADPATTAGSSSTIPYSVEPAMALADAATRAGDRILKSLQTKNDGAGARGARSKNRRSPGTSDGCRAAGRKVVPPAHYVVKSGDNLWSIARRHYKRGQRYRRIVRANSRQIADHDLIYPCQRFFLPG